MKTIKALFLVAIFSFTTIMAHANTEPTTGLPDLQSQVSELITSANWAKIDSDVKIMVKFTISSDSQLIVLSTDNEEYDSRIKSLLNYKVVDSDVTLEEKIFYLPVTLSTK